MSTSIEDRNFTVSLSVRESERVRLYVHENLREGYGFTLSLHPREAARIHDLTDFVWRNRRSLDAEATRRGLGTLRWEMLHVTEHRVERHEDSYDWSGLINAPLEDMALAI